MTLHVPLITPLRRDGAIDTAGLARLAHAALRDGAAGVVLFGTLGEGQSFSEGERRAALEALLAAGVAPAAVNVGVGAAALTDTVALARHALSLGCDRLLLLPPFFFKGVTDEGVYRFSASLIERSGAMRLTLYDIPSVVAVEFAHDVVARLVREFPEAVTAIKDSVADWDHIRRNIEAFPQLKIFVGNEVFLPQALAAGGAGAISGLGNIAAPQMAALAARAEADDAMFVAMSRLYRTIGRHPVIPAVKALAARVLGDDSLAEPRPPLVRFELSRDPELGEALDALRAFDVRVAALAS